MGFLGSILFSRTAGAALVVGAAMGWLEWNRPKRTVIQELDRDLGWVMVPDQKHHDRHLEIEERINEYGFRGGPWARKPEQGVRRVAVLGSSMTYGSSVEESRLYTTLLESGLRGAGIPCEVLNCAVQGYTLEQSLKNYVLKVRPLAPELVIYAMADQDVKPAESVGVPPRGDLRPWLTRTEYYRAFQWDVQPWLRKLAPENPKPGWLVEENKQKQAKVNDTLAGNPFAPELMPLWEAAGKTLERFYQEVHADGALFAVTVLPQRPQAMNPKFSGPEQIVKRVLKAKDRAVYIDAITDLQTEMSPIRDRMLAAPTPEAQSAAYMNAGNADTHDVYQASDRGHFNGHGMQIIAAALQRGLDPRLR